MTHLACDLVRIGGRRLTSRQWQRVQFPVNKTAADFRAGLKDRLPGVHPDHWTILRRYQPYRRGEGPKSIRWLQRLSNMDKHRVLIPAVVSVHGVNINVETDLPVTNLSPLLVPKQVLKIGTPVMRVVCEITTGAGEAHVNMYGNLAVYPTLGYGTPMLDILGSIDKTVFGILQTFDEIL